MADAKERLMQWLRDAHAMEEQAETMLNGQLQRLEHYPELEARIASHLEETKHQATKVRSCIERLGGNTSSLKDVSARTVALGQALSGLFVGDEVIKGSLAGYTFEHMEIASYRILIAAAEAAGEQDVVQVCSDILAEEEAMAAWLEEHLGTVTRQYLSREAAGLTAKR